MHLIHTVRVSLLIVQKVLDRSQEDVELVVVYPMSSARDIHDLCLLKRFRAPVFFWV